MNRPITQTSAGGESWQLASDYLRSRASLDPTTVEALGREPESHLPRLTPEAFDSRAELDRATLRRLRDLGAHDVLAVALTERLEADTALYDCGFTTTLLAPLATPVHSLRQVFDGLPRDSDADWDRVADHLASAAEGFRDYAQTLSQARGSGIALRQVQIVADQVDSWIDPSGTNFYDNLIRGHVGDRKLGDKLATAATSVSSAASDFVRFLREDLARTAVDRDAVGPDRYAVTSAAFLGAETDPADLYEYGWSELTRLHRAAHQLGTELTGESDLAAARRSADVRPGSRVRVGDDLVRWLQTRLDRATDRLAGIHFDLPVATSRVEAKMVTAGSGVMYYSAPDPGLTRPGRVWWSVPPGTQTVPTWREVSTVHHEGLPGHHLQFAITQGVRDLHPWQRYLCHVHGYAEGWAHYSEQLAVDLGLLEDEVELLGVYGAQLWRAARIVIDLGLHLGFHIPPGNGFTQHRRWTPQVAAEFLAEIAGIDPVTASWEVDRYLGWPGQALAFKVGARLWAQTRSARQSQLGADFNLKEFHMDALRLGPMGLRPLHSCLAQDEARAT